MIKTLVLKEVSREVNGKEVALGTHTGHVPEGNICLAYYKLTATKHDAVHAWKKERIKDLEQQFTRLSESVERSKVRCSYCK